MMEAARALGIAARFVSGYVYVPPTPRTGRLGGGATHAWCQVYLPGSGWLEFDPTNGLIGGEISFASRCPRLPRRLRR